MASAYTDNLGRFVNSLCSRFSATIPGKWIERCYAFIYSGNQDEVLKLLREETVLFVMKVRLLNQERKEE